MSKQDEMTVQSKKTEFIDLVEKLNSIAEDLVGEFNSTEFDDLISKSDWINMTDNVEYMMGGFNYE